MQILLNKKQLIEEFFDFLDGRQTIYHGTSKQNKDKILNDGLKGSYTGAPGTATDDVLGGSFTGDASNGKIFTTTSRMSAAGYAASHRPDGSRITGLSPKMEQIKMSGQALKNYITGEGIVKARVDPKMQRKEVLNPEYKKFVDQNNIEHNDFIPQPTQSMMGVKTFGKDKVYKQDLNSDQIIGGKGYKRPEMNETLSEIRKNFEKKSKYTKLRNSTKYGSNKNIRKNIKIGGRLVALNTGIGLGSIGYMGNKILGDDE